MNKTNVLISTAVFRHIVGSGLILIFCCSCKKSGDKEYSVYANSAVDALRFAATNGANGSNRHISAAAEVYSGAIKSDVDKQLAMETAQAGQFLLQLHESDHLPGVSKDEHGQLTTDIVPVLVSNKLIDITYPMKRIFHLVINEETATNNYMLMKPAKDAEWKLEKAWQTDSQGRITEEWSVK